MPNDARKQTVWFSEDMLAEMQREAVRQERSLSWLAQRAWKVARDRIRAVPGIDDIETTTEG